MTRKQKRLGMIAAGGCFLAAATPLTVVALGQKASYFFMPSELAEADIAAGPRIRLGGLVAKGSVERGTGAMVSFAVTDMTGTVDVTYAGILPDLFREEQGVIAEGVLGADGVLAADSVLAKHDETYMPKEVADSLKAKGVWQEPAEAVSR